MGGPPADQAALVNGKLREQVVRDRSDEHGCVGIQGFTEDNSQLSNVLPGGLVCESERLADGYQIDVVSAALVVRRQKRIFRRRVKEDVQDRLEITATQRQLDHASLIQDFAGEEVLQNSGPLRTNMMVNRCEAIDVGVSLASEGFAEGAHLKRKEQGAWEAGLTRKVRAIEKADDLANSAIVHKISFQLGSGRAEDSDLTLGNAHSRSLYAREKQADCIGIGAVAPE